MRLTRSTLHEWVWRLPLAELAEALQTSSSGLAKACKALHIPLPPKGHWRKVETGKPVSIEPLIAGDADADTSYDFDDAQLEARSRSLAARYAHTAEHAKTGSTRKIDLGEVPAAPTATPASLVTSSVQSQQPTESIVRRAGCAIDTVAEVDPIEQLFELAKRHRSTDMARQLLDELCRAKAQLDPAASAVLTLWIDRAKEALLAEEPTHQIAAACRRIADGVERPRWWEEVSRGGWK